MFVSTRIPGREAAPPPAKNTLLRRNRPTRGYRTLAAALLLSAAPVSPALPGGPEAGFWEPTLAEAEALSREDRRPVLLLFPPPRTGEVPPVLLQPAALRKAWSGLHGARARAREVDSLLGRFQVAKLPALLLLDPHGDPLGRWEGDLPPDVWPQVDRAAKRALAAQEDLARSMAAMEAALEREDYAAAAAAAREVRSRARPGWTELEAAVRAEGRLLAKAAGSLRSVLAREGLVPDERLARDLLVLRERFPHVRVEERIDRETARLRGRTLGGARPSGAK